MKMRRWQLRLTPPHVMAAAVLTVMGILSIYSATHQEGWERTLRQLLWAGVGAAVYLGITRLSYLQWLDGAYLAYGLTVTLLGAVLLIGEARLGASRWLEVGGFSFQPTELAKIGTALALARHLGEAMSRSAHLRWPTVLKALALCGVPAGIVFAQPDLGSATVFIVMALAALWVAGLSRRQALTMAALAGAILPIGWRHLKGYQRDRLLVFLNPNLDPLGAGYTIIQSKIAVGSGWWWGRGWLGGSQNQLNFLPERHTDFIFSVIGEAWGFAGSLVVLGCLAWLLTAAVTIARDNHEPSGRILAATLCAVLGYQSLVNVGMTIGLLPVVGLPLPLVSYGGSALVMAWAALALLTNISVHGTRF
ncbi:MAG: rod shape-determining protein RodA [Candidatus Omnitrophica bacterium]|nr:rod shape-determining protein RodA [Candidatus Omnitrophota bacterium]